LSWLKRQQPWFPIIIATFNFKDVAKAAQV